MPLRSAKILGRLQRRFLVEIAVAQLHSLAWCVNLYQEPQLLEPYKMLRRAHPLLLYPIDTRFVRSIPSSRETGSCPHRTLLTFFQLPYPESPQGALPEATRSGRAALCGGTSPPHRLTTHQNTKTCSTERLRNVLKPYLPLVPHLTWAVKKDALLTRIQLHGLLLALGTKVNRGCHFS